jgi:hypothetical protein
MKTKLTLSIDRRKVAKLRKASARKGTSISGLVEDLADRLDEAPSEAPEVAITQYLGTLELPDEAFEEDSRGGAELRKTAYYEQLKKKRKRA